MQFINKNSSKTVEQSMLHIQQQKTSLLPPWGFLFGSRYGYNLP